MRRFLTRRRFIGTASAVAATPAVGQIDTTPPAPSCAVFQRFSGWTVESGRYDQPSMFTNEVQINGAPRKFGVKVSSFADEFSGFWQGSPRDTARASYPKAIFYWREDGFGLRLTFGKLENPSLNTAMIEAIDTTKATVVLFAGATEIVRFVDLTKPEVVAVINLEAFLQALSGVANFIVQLYVGPPVAQNLVMQAIHRVEGLNDALNAMNQTHIDHVTELQSAGRCGSGSTAQTCAMTTAAVGYLGRADDCFELTQVRGLRTAFPKYTWVIEDYLFTSATILARPGPRLTVALMVFYVLTVWPTALLARVGLRKPAGCVYLIGFALLKLSMGLNPFRPMSGPSFAPQKHPEGGEI